MQALDEIRVLQASRGLLSEVELAQRARAILERADMRPLNLTEFLKGHGFEGVELFRAVGTFGKAVKAAYIAHYGCEPLTTFTLVNGELARVKAYVELDRPIIEQVFEGWKR